MGVSAGRTPDTGDHDPRVGATNAGDGDHHALVAFEGRATTGGTAFRTAYLMKLDAGQCEVKKPLVGRFPKIELDIRELNFYHSTWLNSPPDTKQQWDVKGTVAMRKISELWTVGWSFSFFIVTNRSVVLYYSKVKGVAIGDTLQDYINNYLRPENGADLSPVEGLFRPSTAYQTQHRDQ